MLTRTIADKKRLAHKISSAIGEALCDFGMLVSGDRVLVGVSGGKDSLSLLKILLERRSVTPFPYEVIACHVKSSFDKNAEAKAGALETLFKKWQVAYEIIPLAIELKAEEAGTSCFWCSWNRRKILFETAARLQCTKLALGHHKDDLIETAVMNLFYQANFKTMSPKQSYFKGEFDMIRPLAYVDEADLLQYAADLELEIDTCDCPIGEASERRRTKDLLTSLALENPKIKSNIFQALIKGALFKDASEPGIPSTEGE